MSITWNGVSSDTIGVIVERIPNRYVPTRRFSPQQVAGRNGNILLVDKSFPNVEQEYEVYLSAESQGLPSVARACAEWLMGPDGYCRLQDSYDTTVYREAFLMGGYDLENILNKFGRCTITFSCKPQKYLLTGDTPISIPAGPTTYTGDVVQFDGVTGASITSLSTTISPIQDLHGYSSPWPAGGGKNLLPLTVDGIKSENAGTWVDNTYSNNGVTFTILTDNSGNVIGIQASGTVTGSNASLRLPLPTNISVGDSVVLNGNPRQSKPATRIWVGTSQYEDIAVDIGLGTTFTYSESVARIWLQVFRYNTVNGVIYTPMIRLSTETDATFSPYSNICPISGMTGLSVYRTGKNLLNPQAVGVVDAKGNNFCGIKYEFIGSFYISASARPSAGNIYLVVKRANGTYDPDRILSNSSINIGYAITLASGDVIWIVDASSHGTSGIGTAISRFEAAKLQLEFGSTATTYEPYNGNTYAVDWTSEAGTVYGGTLDVVTGVLTVDRANIASYNGEVINEPWLSSMDAYVEGATPTTGAQVVYTLATPLTYQLTAQEVAALVGENNVWTSSGPVSVTVEAPFSGIVTNPTPFEARPMLEVSGVGEITINGKSIHILESVSDFEIDCEAMEAEDNSKIYCMDFPELSGGENEIIGDSSITSLMVVPRWWTL